MSSAEHIRKRTPLRHEDWVSVPVGRRDNAIVDPELGDWAISYRWRKKEGYAVRYEYDPEFGAFRTIKMHREVLELSGRIAPGAPGVGKGALKVWHKNGRLMDNRIRNLIILPTNLAGWNAMRAQEGA